MFYTAESFIEKGDMYFNKKDFSNAKLEYEKALNIISIGNRTLKKELQNKLESCRKELSSEHYQYGINYMESDEFKKALDEMNIAINLEVDSDIRKKISKKISEIENKLEKKEILEQYNKNIDAGNSFLESGEYSEAYVEFKEVYENIKDLKTLNEEKKEIEEKLKDIEHRLSSKYIKKAKKYIENKKFEQAWTELEYAQAIVDSFDKKDILEIENMHKILKKHIAEEQNKENTVVKENILEKAIERFEDATDLYFRFGFSENNPYNPKYENSYENAYNNARKSLAKVYHEFGDSFMEKKKTALAFKFYNDALSLLNEEDNIYMEILGKIEVIQKLKRDK